MYVTRRQDRVYRAYSIWAPDKKGNMRSQTVLAGFLGYYSDIVRNDPDGYEKLKAKVRKESKLAVEAQRKEDTAKLMEELEESSEETDSKEPFAGHPGLDYSNYVLMPIWKELGLPRVLNYHWSPYEAEFDAPTLIYQSVVNRIVNPCSHLRHIAEKLNWLGAPLRNDTEFDLYRMLDFAYLQKDTILKTVNRNIHKMGLRDLTVVFYDCTNTWYETPFTDEQKLEMRISTKLAAMGPEATDEERKKAVSDIIRRTTSTYRMRGPSKEGRHDPLISIALVVDRNGIPIDFYIYRGNSSEKVTMEDSINALEKKYHIKNTIVVADGGLNTVPNIRRLDKRGHGFLMSRSVPKMNKTLRDRILSKDGWHEYKDGTLRLKEIELEIEGEVDKNGVKGEPIKTRLIAGWSKKHEQEDLYRIAAHKKAAEQAIRDKKDMRSVKVGWKKYVKSAESIASELNHKNIEKDLEIAGYFAYQFKDGRSHDKDWLKNPTEEVTAMEVMEQYHCLSRIEECFRIMKTNFDLRPLHVYIDVHIVSQVLICVLALIVIRVLAKKLEKAGHKMTIDEIIFALANAKVAALMNPGSPTMFAPISMERIKLSEGKYPKFRPYRHTPLSRIMEVVGLKPLPAYCCKNRLGKCLGTRFDKDLDAVGILDPKFLHNDTTKNPETIL